MRTYFEVKKKGKKKSCLLVCHGELVDLMFVGCQLILDTGHQIIVVGVPDGPLDNIQPPGRIQIDLEKEDNHIEFSFKFILTIFAVFCSTGVKIWFQ